MAKDKESVSEKQVKVRMQTVYAGPNGTCGIGKVIQLPEAEAKGLIEGNFAQLVEPESKEVPVRTQIDLETKA